MTKVFLVGKANSLDKPATYNLRELIKFLVTLRVGDRVHLARER